MKDRALLIPALLTAAAVALWVRSCSGPRPRVVSAELRGDTAIVTVQNDGRGEGEIQVSVRLEAADGGPPLAAEQRIDLRSGETARLALPVRGARGNERVKAEVEYPPR